MKFIRRPDLAPQTRIEIVMTAWLYQGVYGKITHIAQGYHISRTFLSQLLLAATLQLEVRCSDDQCQGQHESPHITQLVLLLRLEGRCALPSIASILKRLDSQPNSVGYRSAFFQRYGQSLPSTLSMGATKVVFYLSDEIFATHQPILVPVDAKSTTILKIELASERSAPTWKAHFAALDDHRFHRLGMAADRGVGLVAGYHAACQEALWVRAQFHALHDLFPLGRQWERKAYGAIGKEDDAAQKFAQAKSDATRQKRLHQYEQACQAGEQAIAQYDQRNRRLHLLRET